MLKILHATKNDRVIVHLSKLNYLTGWFPSLVNFLTLQGYDQAFFKLSRNSKLPLYSPAGNVTHLDLSSGNALRSYVDNFILISFLYNLRRRGVSIILLSQGHKESMLCYLLKRVFDYKYGIVLHHPPQFFKLFSQERFIRAKIHQKIYLTYIKNADFVQSLSQYSTNELQIQGVKKSRIFERGLGLDFERVRSQWEIAKKSNDRIDSKVLIMIGRLSWEKNYFFALKVFREIVNTDFNYRLVIFGTGPLESKITSCIETLGLRDFVRLEGYSESALSQLCHSGALLHLSKTESYGQVLIEAALMQVPVLTFDVGIASQLCEIKNSPVRILNNGSFSEVASQILELMKNGEKSSRRFYDKELSNHELMNVFSEFDKFLSRVM